MAGPDLTALDCRGHAAAHDGRAPRLYVTGDRREPVRAVLCAGCLAGLTAIGMDWRPARPRGISEADLFQGYSGRADRRRLPMSTVETVRRDLAAADETEPAVGPGSRDDVAAETRP